MLVLFLYKFVPVKSHLYQPIKVTLLFSYISDKKFVVEWRDVHLQDQNGRYFCPRQSFTLCIHRNSSVIPNTTRLHYTFIHTLIQSLYHNTCYTCLYIFLSPLHNSYLMVQHKQFNQILYFVSMNISIISSILLLIIEFVFQRFCFLPLVIISGLLEFTK